VLDAEFTTQIVEQQEEMQEVREQQQNTTSYIGYEQQQDVQEVSALFLAKRTPISYWKKGSWSASCQWRDEAVVKLCPVQHAENDGLLAVELMYPNTNAQGCAEICIFDEFNRPAKVLLDKPAIFYVPTNSLYHRDLSTKKYIPFHVGTEVVIASQAQGPSVSQNYAPAQQQSNNDYYQYEDNHNIYQQEQRHASY